jgi:hypothetical protein
MDTNKSEKEVLELIQFLQDQEYSEEEALNLLMLTLSVMTNSLIVKMEEGYHQIDVSEAIKDPECEKIQKGIMGVVSIVSPLLPLER